MRTADFDVLGHGYRAVLMTPRRAASLASLVGRRLIPIGISRAIAEAGPAKNLALDVIARSLSMQMEDMPGPTRDQLEREAFGTVHRKKADGAFAPLLLASGEFAFELAETPADCLMAHFQILWHVLEANGIVDFFGKPRLPGGATTDGSTGSDTPSPS